MCAQITCVQTATLKVLHAKHEGTISPDAGVATLVLLTSLSQISRQLGVNSLVALGPWLLCTSWRRQCLLVLLLRYNLTWGRESLGSWVSFSVN